MMATGVVSVDTSDEILDNVCSVCTEQNKTVGAAKYCVDCHDYYCSDCVNIHTTVPALKGHKILEKDVGQSGKLPMVPTKRCERHSFKAVDMYCQNHNVVGCYTCMAVDHRTCQDVFYIPEFVKTKPNVVSEFLQRLVNTETKLRDFLKMFKKEVADLQTNKRSEIEKVKTYTKQLEERIKEAEKDAISEIQDKYKELNEDLHEHIDSLQQEQENIRSARANIDSIVQNKSQAFVTMLFSKSKVLSAEDTVRYVEKIKLGRRVKFLLYPQYKLFMTRKLYLGKVIKMPYNFVHKGEFSIKINSDSETCDVYGSCILSDGSIIFADQRNKTLKRVDAIYLKVVDHYILSSQPWEVCCKNNIEVAICLPHEKKIQVFKVNSKMSLQKSICLAFSCWGISFFDDQYYITDDKRVHVCSNEGMVLKTISKDSANNLIFSNIWNVFVSKYYNVIFLSDYSKHSIISIDGNGNILNFVSNKISFPHGLTAADNGKVFACGYLSKNVILLNENGEFEADVITEHLTGPQALCFNCKTRRLYVPNHNSDNVQIFELD